MGINSVLNTRKSTGGEGKVHNNAKEPPQSRIEVCVEASQGLSEDRHCNKLRQK